MNFKALIDLYRVTGRPIISEGKFFCQTNITSELHSLLLSNYSQNRENFDELIINEQFINESSEITSNGTASFTIRLPTRGGERFYKSIDDLLTINSVSKGTLPPIFYIIDYDYCYKEGDHPLVASLETICEMIRSLSNIATYQDSKSINNYYKLIFINSSENNQKYPVELETNITPEILRLPSPDLTLLKELVNDEESTTVHYHSKRLLFSSTLADYLKQRPDGKRAFAYLIENWSNFLDRYNNDFSTYLSGFAFHKAKIEVAKSELELADQFSKVIGDINSKILSIPLSIAGIIAILKAKNTLESLLLIIGLFLISWLAWEVVKNQERHLDRIKRAKSVMFNSFEGNKDNYPTDLQNEIQDFISSTNNHQKILEDKLACFLIFSWAPFVIGISVFLYSKGFFLFLWKFFWRCLFYGCGVQ